MAREAINPVGMPALNPTYSQAIKANGFIFVSGQIGVDPKTGKLISDDIDGQTRQAIENVARILHAAGSSLHKVVSASLFLTEFDRLSQVNVIYAEYFKREGPAKFSCGVARLYGAAKFEIQVVALA